jgi:hypothetical protein
MCWTVSFERLEVTAARAVGSLPLTSHNYQATSLHHGIHPRRQWSDRYTGRQEFRLLGSRVGNIAPVRRSICSVVSALVGLGLKHPNAQAEKPRPASVASGSKGLSQAVGSASWPTLILRVTSRNVPIRVPSSASGLGSLPKASIPLFSI